MIEQPPYPTLNILKAEFVDLLVNSHAEFDVEWFLKLIRSPQPEEAPKLVYSKGSDVWVWPYEIRVLYLFKKYMGSTHDFQQFIIAARHDGIDWLGDEPTSFYRVVEEHERMKEMGAEKYHAETTEKYRAKTKEILKHITGINKVKNSLDTIT